LLVRHRRGVTPTRAGEALAEHARAILQQVDAARDVVSSIANVPSGTLRVGVSTSISWLFVPALVQAARARMPQVRLRVSEGSSGVLKSSLSDGRLDMCVLRFTSDTAGIESYPLFFEEVVLVGPLDAFASGEAVSMPAFLRRPNLVTAPSSWLRVLYEQQAATSGEATGPLIEVDSYPALIELAAQGAGVTMLPYSTIHAAAVGGRLSWASVAPRAIKRRVCIARRSEQPETPAWRVAMDVIRSTASALSDEYRWTVES
jgi:LysR family nitrogen assimilation transcriptional regulator